MAVVCCTNVIDQVAVFYFVNTRWQYYYCPLLANCTSLEPAFSSLKLVYSKQLIIGLTHEFCWVGACVGGGELLSKQLSYRDLTRFNKIAIQGTPQMAVD